MHSSLFWCDGVGWQKFCKYILVNVPRTETGDGFYHIGQESFTTHVKMWIIFIYYHMFLAYNVHCTPSIKFTTSIIFLEKEF